MRFYYRFVISFATFSAASRILNSMKLDVDPCNDFFQYACGNWVDDKIIAADQSSVSTFNGLRDDVSAALKRMYINAYLPLYLLQTAVCR